MGISRSSASASKKLDEVLKAYEFHDHQHAIAILTIDYPDLLSEICDVLLAFRISIDFIKKAGGNELVCNSQILPIQACHICS